MGPISLFTLVMVLCMATLCVLCVATAHATLKMSERSAAATQATYRNEQAAQLWLASIVQHSNPTQDDLDEANEKAQAGFMDSANVAVDSEIIPVGDAVSQLGLEGEVDARSFRSAVKASFQTGSGKLLDVVVALRRGGGYQVLAWKATAQLSEEPPTELLWSGM